MLRKLVMAACCVALGGIAVATTIASKNANGAIGSAHEAQAQSSSGAQNAQPAPNADTADVPAHHETAPKDPLPGTLDPTIFPDVINQNIYALAAKEKKVLYQQPCYCHCDHEVGHKSLLDCYVDRHASVCAVCKMEAVFAYQETKKGKSPAQIREEIIQGKWRTVDLTSYQTPGAVPPDTKAETK